MYFCKEGSSCLWAQRFLLMMVWALQNQWSWERCIKIIWHKWGGAWSICHSKFPATHQTKNCCSIWVCSHTLCLFYKKYYNLMTNAIQNYKSITLEDLKICNTRVIHDWKRWTKIKNNLCFGAKWRLFLLSLLTLITQIKNTIHRGVVKHFSRVPHKGRWNTSSRVWWYFSK